MCGNTVYRTLSGAVNTECLEMSTKTERIEVRASPEFVEKVDDWRRHQPDIPSRGSAVRQLVEIALAKLEQEAKKKR
jgi:hypothetical protein